MENPYIKQFPDLMKGKKIMYNHGFVGIVGHGKAYRPDFSISRSRCLRHTPAPVRGYRFPETKGKRRQSRPYHRHFYGWNVHRNAVRIRSYLRKPRL